MKSLLPLIALSAACAGWMGCAQKYTRHMTEDYKDRKIDSVTIGIISLPEMTYMPPSGCGGGGKSSDGPRYQKEWDAKMVKKLTMSFKKQRFVSIPAERLEELGIDAAAFFSAADADLEKVGVEQYEAQGGSLRPLEYLPRQSGNRMGAWGRTLREKDSIDYFIALIDPKMSGEVHTTYNAQGGMSSQTVYTTNARFGVWSAETGEIAYASGSIAASSGFCFFVSPQSASIEGNSGDMSTQLKALIAAFLRSLPDERVELGQAAQ